MKKILYKSKQACAYGDDIALIARNMPALQKMLITLQEIGVKYGLCINEEKTNYMKMKATPSDKLPKVTIWQYTFENVRNFAYLGVLLNSRGAVTEEINKKIMTDNKAYYSNSSFLKAHSSQDQPIVTHATETWTLNISDENALRIFEWKIIRKIYGPVCEDGVWRVRSNSEINSLLQGEGSETRKIS
jgi:hypothetical protein